ncbi:MAG TPA: AbrB family transcriptional regulator [Anaerovoracaceae bacterium]|nr:AbrB family transcriptional regulator [Anaerovoracaceae bacterium]
MEFLLTLAAGFVIGAVFFKLKVPGGMMVGAIVGAAILNIFAGHAYMPDMAQQAAKITAGAFVGCSVEREDLIRLRHIYKPFAAMMTAMLVLNLLVGFVIYKLTDLNLLTSLLCAVPGGVGVLPLIAQDMGADATSVAVMQFARMVVGVGFFPTFILWVDRMQRPLPEAAAETASPPAAKTEPSKEKKSVQDFLSRHKPFFTAAACAVVCGAVGVISPIPSGGMLLSMLGILGLKLMRVPVHLPRWVRRCGQLLAGCYVGYSVTYRDLLDLRQLAVPILIMLAGYLLNSYLSGRMLHRFFGLTLKQGMLANSPAGASDMALISADIGVQSADVIILQVLRMLMAVSVFPYLMHFLARIAAGI